MHLSLTCAFVSVQTHSAADGMAAVSELDPGLVTGPLSTIWGSLIRDLVTNFGLGPDELVVAPYDWRLPPSKLQQRDKYFSSLKRKSASVLVSLSYLCCH